MLHVNFERKWTSNMKKESRRIDANFICDYEDK